MLAGKQIDYRLFIYNRALRLLPLLGTVIVVVGTTHALRGALSLSAFYSWFNASGGFYNFPSYPSPSAAWILLPTIEGACYALLIGWYDHWQKSTGLISLAIGKMGEYSYSIYLLHFFVVFDLAHLIHSRIADISNFYVALLWCLPSFGLVSLMSGLSYHFIELPFLKHRRNYLKTT